jgi:50S ribosomal protein L16 3-hydroxylase
VGPHYDQYDVFLIQGEGRREWKIGQMCSENSELIEHLPVKVLAQFEEEEVWVLEPGDMLYLPPALAHWGTAVDNCITYSVGFRAPAVSEVLSDFGHFLSNQLSDFKRYSDESIENRSQASGQIMQSDIARLQEIITAASRDKSLVAQWLGHYMTEPKYDDTAVDTGNWSTDKFLKHWQHNTLVKNPASRFAYYENTLFVDGSALELPCSAELLTHIDQNHSFSLDSLPPLSLSDVNSIFCSLVNLGALYFDEDC